MGSHTKEQVQKYNKNYYQKNKEKILKQVRNYDLRNWDKVLRCKRNRQATLRRQVLEYYGNGNLKCLLCKESRLTTLTIDHINNDGNKHRKEVGSGLRFYRWLIRNKYPEGFQTICMNCQFVRREEEKNRRLNAR